MVGSTPGIAFFLLLLAVLISWIFCRRRNSDLIAGQQELLNTQLHIMEQQQQQQQQSQRQQQQQQQPRHFPSSAQISAYASAPIYTIETDHPPSYYDAVNLHNEVIDSLQNTGRAMQVKGKGLNPKFVKVDNSMSYSNSLQ